MDRQIVYAGSIPLETDLLNTNRNTMVALGKLASSLFGSQTIVNGLAVTPALPTGLSVNVAPGELYTLTNLDSSAYSSLGADTVHQLMKQGIALGSTTLTVPAPVSSGQSINYLIQAMYQDLDTGASVLPYYSSSNPVLAWSGPANAGTPQYTQRKGSIVINAKAGAAAATGSQVTPSPDSGFVGLYVVTVANGQSSITASNISQYANAPILPSGLLQAIQAGRATYGTEISTTANICKVNLSPAVSSLTDGMIVMFQVANANTGAVTLSLNGLSAAPVIGGAHQPLQGGELVAGGRAEVVWHAGLASWVVLGCTGGAVQVGAAGLSRQAVNMGQLTSASLALKTVAPSPLDVSSYVPTTGWVQTRLGNYQDAKQLYSDTTLTVNNGGTLYQFCARATATLPSLSVAQSPAPSVFTFWNNCGVTATVAASGSDLIWSNSYVHSLDVKNGETLVVAAMGGLWVVVSSSAFVLTSPSFISMFSGMVSYFAMSAAPSGWLKCNGAAVSRTSYANLFAAIGTTFGAGDGSTTFGLPDLRGEFLRGYDDGRGVDSGRVLGKLQLGSFIAYDLDGDGGTAVVGVGGATSFGPSQYDAITSDYSTTGIVTPYVNKSDNTTISLIHLGVARPRNIALLACIKI